ncbi:hypothetical protein MASR1M45_15670 [Candidatus Kapaibacterium sp.]
MNLKLFIPFLFFVGYYSAISQTLIIQRTDLQNPNAGFVTATYSFSFEILLDGVPNSNSIAFRLNYDMADYIKFSEWRKGDFDVLQAVNIYNDDGTADLVIGVSSGINPQSSDKLQPKVIELEFVVTKNAPNLNNLRMSFERPYATAINDGVGVNIPLTAPTLDYKIHSYVNVWPGDTDNNGIVDHLDFVPISQYIGMGSASKGFRSFKRAKSSALWTPQRVLTWDSAAVTYVDCDGNADITTTDMLIVTYNLGKDSLYPHGKNSIFKEETSNEWFLSKDIFESSFYINSEGKFKSVAGSFRLLKDDITISNIKSGSIFPKNTYNYFFEKDDKIYFVISNSTSTVPFDTKGELFVVTSEKNFDIQDLLIEEIYGINESGEVFELKNILSSVDDNNDKVSIQQNFDNLFISCNDNFQNIRIFDVMGNVILKESITNRNQITVNTTDFLNGIYLIEFSDGVSRFIKKISIIK